MSLAYRLMYRLGFTPWDRMLPKELADAMKGPDALPAGRALDMGSGFGTKAIFMASSGWRVTAVESVPRALEEARRRAAKAGLKVDFRRGDVTRLQELNLEPGYDLVFDFGCFHGLNDKQRDAYALGVNSLTASGATLLMMAFTRPVPPVTKGVSEPELLQRFGPAWSSAGSRAADIDNPSSASRRGAAGWFHLVKS